ncbi:transport and Golgi organization protein 1 homolog [Sardina pilchardus]|uniref:transport and Golgi organization protein 1 homolog n=1 Tax=Sardina pilchardus TaxID=27697 RepID=UPI002E0F5CBE
MGTIGFWYFMTFSQSLFFMAMVQLLYMLKAAINGKLKEHHGIESKVDDRVLQLFQESYDARLTDLNFKNKKLQEELKKALDSQRCIKQENEGLKRENKDMKEKIKLLNQTLQDQESSSRLKEMASKNQRKVPSVRTFLVAVFSMVLAKNKVRKLQTDVESYQKDNINLKSQFESVHAEMELCRKENSSLKDQVQYATIQIEVERRHTELKLTALQRKMQELERELEGKDNSCKAQMASLERKAHKRLVKASALQRQLYDKKAEVFFLHHKLMDFMDWVAELRGTKFVPLPLYSHNQKPSHKRVRDDWRDLLTKSRLQLIPEEQGDFASELDPRMASVNQAIIP